MAISDDQKAEVLALHAEGLARSKIARHASPPDLSPTSAVMPV